MESLSAPVRAYTTTSLRGPDGNIELSKMRGEQPDAGQTTEKTESDAQTEVAADKAEETTEQEKPEASAEASAEAEAEASEDDTVGAPEDAAAEEPEVSQDKTSDVEDWMESEGVSKDDLEKHLKNTGLDKES